MVEAEQATLEVWKVTIEVQKHFNDLGMRVRSIAVTVLGALLAAAGYALKERSTVDFIGQKVPLTGTILLAALICWLAFFVMDRLWYHRLLKAAVLHGQKVEAALISSLPTVGLTRTIDEASPLLGLRAGHRLSIFYGVIGVLLWLAAGTALKISSPYYIIGIILFVVGMTLELSFHSEAKVNRRRGFLRLGMVVGAIYFGWWAITWWFASSALPRYVQWHREALSKQDWNTSAVWLKAIGDASDAVEMSAIWGIGVPTAALLVGGLFYWLYRGFRPRSLRTD